MASFWKDLGKIVSEKAEVVAKKTGEVADVVVKKTEQTVEVQKIKSQIHVMQRNNDRDYKDIGKMIYDKFKNSKTVAGCMTGLKPAVIGFIGSAIISIGQTVFVPNGFSTAIFTNPTLYVSLVIFIGALIATFKKVHPIIIICLSAVAGIV